MNVKVVMDAFQNKTEVKKMTNTLEQITLQHKPKRRGLLTRLLPLLTVGALAGCDGGGQATGCKKDFDCDEGKVCVAEKCVTPGEYCTSDYDCPGDSVCENNVCSGYNSSGSIPETTKIVDDNAASSLLSMSNDKSTIVFNTNSSYAQQLKVGDVMVAGVYDNIPVGLLRKVISKTETSSGITLQTNQATLEDAIESGTLNEKISFTPEYLSRASPLMSGVSLGLIKAPLSVDLNNKQVLSVDFESVELYHSGNGNVMLDGDLTLGLEMGLQLKMSSSKVKYVKFTMEGTEDFNLQLTGEFEVSISKELPAITPIKFSPIVFMAGYVPVVVVPELSITFGLEAQGSLSLETSVSQGMSAMYGLEYDGNWTTLEEFDDYFDFNAPTFSNTSASAEAYAKPELMFKLYGVAGPSAGATGYVKGEIEPLSDPWCSLSAGLKVNAGFEVGALGKTLINYENVLYEYEKELYQCDGGTTCTDQCSDGEAKCSGGDGWKLCGDYDGNGCVEWGDVMYCNSDEYCESGECKTKTCATEEWQCYDNFCISPSQVCDGSNDCSGGEDEADCCINECSYTGEKGCTGNSTKLCGDYDSDKCLEWDVVSCGSNFSCESGECVYNPICTPDCSGKECGDDGCGDSCGSCSGGEKCDNSICNDTSCDLWCSYAGEKGCSGTAVGECMYDNNDNCLKFEITDICQYGKYCEDGECVGSCKDTCSPTLKNGCPTSTSFSECADKDNDGCFEIYNIECEVGEKCKDGECQSECTSKSGKTCSGQDLYWVDSCDNLESLIQHCPDKAAGYTCVDGECKSTVCSNECNSLGSKNCNFAGDYQECGNYDNDTCLEWSSIQGCWPPEKTCINGECVTPTTTCYSDSDCSAGYLCKKTDGECVKSPTPLCTGVSCIDVKINVNDNGGDLDDSFGLEIVGAFYGETPYGGSKTWTVPMTKNKNYQLVLYGVGVPDGIGTYEINLTNATFVNGGGIISSTSASGDDLDAGMSFDWEIKTNN